MPVTSLVPRRGRRGQQAKTDAIRPGKLTAPAAALENLRRRVSATRSPESGTVGDPVSWTPAF